MCDSASVSGSMLHSLVFLYPSTSIAQNTYVRTHSPTHGELVQRENCRRF